MTTIKSNRIYPLIFRISGIIITVSAIISTCFSNGIFRIQTLMYYTILSNLLVLFLFILLTYKTISDLVKLGTKGSSSYYDAFSFVCMIDIIITFLIYWIMLVPAAFKMNDSIGIWQFSNIAVHGIVPILVIIDYFLFTIPKHVHYRNIFFSWFFPLSYVVFVSVIGTTGYVYYYQDNKPIHYPYFFLDYDQNGPLVALYIFVLLVIFSIIGLVFYFSDRYRLKKHERPWKKEV